MPITVVDPGGKRRNARLLQILGFLGLERVVVPEAQAGDIIAFTGIDGLKISDTLCDPSNSVLLETIRFPEPVISVAVEPGRDLLIADTSRSPRLRFRCTDDFGLGDVRVLDDALAVTDAEEGYAVVPCREGLLIPASSGVASAARMAA